MTVLGFLFGLLKLFLTGLLVVGVAGMAFALGVTLLSIWFALHEVGSGFGRRP